MKRNFLRTQLYSPEEPKCTIAYILDATDDAVLFRGKSRLKIQRVTILRVLIYLPLQT